MGERKRFRNQPLNSKDYENTERASKAVKHGGAILGALVLAVGIGKKYGPELLKNMSKFRRF